MTAPCGYQTRGFDYTMPADPMKTVVRDGETFECMLRQLAGARVVGFDTETSGLRWWADSRPCGIALGCWDGDRVRAWYVAFGHRTGEPQLSLETVSPALRAVLAEPGSTKVAHNIKFDEHMVRREGWRVEGPRYCTLIAARLFDENRDAKLKTRARTDLGIKDADAFESHIDWHVKELARHYAGGVPAYRNAFGYSQIPVELAGLYACHDIEFTLRLHDLYERRHGLSERMGRVVGTEMALTEVLCDVEENGLRIDVGYLEALQERCVVEMTGLQDEVWRRFRIDPFELGNDNQLREFLQRLGLRWTHRSPNGKVLSVNKEVLADLARQVPDLQYISRWRLLSKIATTYTSSILDKLDGRGVLHGQFMQVGTETGRLCVDPDTLIEMPRDLTRHPDGIPLRDVKAGDLVYSFDWERRLCLRRVKWVGKTGVRPVVRVTARDKSGHTTSFVCTPDHLVRLFDGRWKHAGTLKPGERLLHMVKRHDWNGYASFYPRSRDRRYSGGEKAGAKVREHRFIMAHLLGRQSLPARWDVHHVDHNPLNNDPANLRQMMHASHISMHRRKTSREQLVSMLRGDAETTLCRKQLRRLTREHGVDEREWTGYCERQRTLTGRNHRVVSVEVLPAREVWDCEIEDTHAFIGNGITLHNSCTQPNLQNFPSDSDDRAVESTGASLKDGGVDPFSVRRAFVNRDPGWVRVYTDYSQAELRVLTAYCRDPILLDTYAKGEDVHTRASIELFGTADPARRRITKVANFGVTYGLSHRGLSRQVGISEAEAQAFMARFFERYAGIPTFKQRFLSQLNQDRGTFTNMWGRRRSVPAISSPDPYSRGKAEREAFAALIQGTASELTKESMVRVWRYCKENGVPALIVNTIHDEIQVDIPIEHMATFVPAKIRMMQDYPDLAPVPVVVDGSYSTTNWAEKKALPKG